MLELKKILIIAYAFPPMSYVGVYRTLRFCKYLPQHNWQPVVLTIKEYGDLEKNYALMDQIPKEVMVYSTKTIDAIRWLRKKRRKNLISAETSINGNNLKTKNSKKDLSRSRMAFSRLKTFLIQLVSFCKATAASG